MTGQAQYNRIAGWLLAGCIALAIVGLLGCTSTITPRNVHDPVPSWDGTNQHSGIIAILDDGRFLVTPYFRDRYHAMLKIYARGKDSAGRPLFAVPPKPDDGLHAGIMLHDDGSTEPAWVMTPQVMSNFARMNRWRKKGTP